ncbi:hypothetical protein GH714_041624 [Hevea brasiliensis]|uniref:PB1-like domain-containing protein n=1 Tax=Hevea brasiliensis TaxID=3981 RepID=A0A6A6MVR7_HEVBR|nr:hypothetical protein GH714_041624 [Hevea brasiliensis]
MYTSILLHHSGVLRVRDGTYEYEGGDMFPRECLDPDLMGYLEIEEELKKQGHGEIKKMAYFILEEGIIYEGENNPIVDNAYSQNIKVVDDNHSVNSGLQNDPSEGDDVNVDSGDSTDEDYNVQYDIQAIDDEYDDEAFEDYITRL